MTNANEVAVAYINDTTPGIYTLNRNYAAYEVSDAGGDFTLYDEQTVRRLVVEQPDLMPNYPQALAIRYGVDTAYNRQQITNAVTSGILMGRSTNNIAVDLMRRITDMSIRNAIRAARTAVTAAENGGRQATYEKAADMGIELEHEWIATKDSRTRDWHGAADGQHVAVDKPFTVGGEMLMYPGDKSRGASGWNLYNCRCAVKAFVKGHRRKRETYSEWLKRVQAETAAESLDDSADYGIIKSGAISGALTEENDPDFKRREAFAQSYYAEIRGRKREYEINAVSKNSGFSRDEIDSVFSHVFELEHLFEDGTVHRFDPDYYMAQSWMRLREGKNILEHDMILLQHELMESKLMGKGTTVPYEQAHEAVSKVYNYKSALMKYLVENELL